MQAQISAQLGMKGEGHGPALTEPDRPPFVAHDDLGAAGVLDDRGADEDAWEVLSSAIQLQRSLERLELAPICVAADCDVQDAKTLLAVYAVVDPVGQQDHPGTGAKRRKAGLEGISNRVIEAHALHQH